MLEVLAEPPLESDVRPEPDPDVVVDVRFADDDVVVVAKPAGLVVHPGRGQRRRHARERAARAVSRRSRRRRPDAARHRAPARPRHERPARRRAIARARTTRSSRSSRRARSSACTSRSCGARSPSPRGVIDAPIGRSGARRTRMAVRDAGKPARTEYEVRRGVRRAACAACSSAGSRPGARIRSACTSRRSVIRSSATAPTAASRDRSRCARPFLHAGTLGFDHPGHRRAAALRRAAAGRARGGARPPRRTQP